MVCHRATSYGYAKMLEWDDISADEFTNAINDGVKDEEMRASLDRVHTQGRFDSYRMSVIS